MHISVLHVKWLHKGEGNSVKQDVCISKSNSYMITSPWSLLANDLQMKFHKVMSWFCYMLYICNYFLLKFLLQLRVRYHHFYGKCSFTAYQFYFLFSNHFEALCFVCYFCPISCLCKMGLLLTCVIKSYNARQGWKHAVFNQHKFISFEEYYGIYFFWICSSPGFVL